LPRRAPGADIGEYGLVVVGLRSLGNEPHATANDSPGVRAGWACWNGTSTFSFTSYVNRCIACCADEEDATRRAGCEAVCKIHR
jgi:hypothetical protein